MPLQAAMSVTCPKKPELAIWQQSHDVIVRGANIAGGWSLVFDKAVLQSEDQSDLPHTAKSLHQRKIRMRNKDLRKNEKVNPPFNLQSLIQEGDEAGMAGA
jgi:hypothetical protein